MNIHDTAPETDAPAGGASAAAGGAAAGESAGLARSTFSGWVDRPAALQDRLRGEITCDVAIVGGGLTGMAAALRLAGHGADVVLLESEFCGYGASSRNAGQLTPRPAGDAHRMLARDPERFRDLARFSSNAARCTERLVERHGIDCGYRPSGSVGVAVTRAQMRTARRTAEALQSAGMDARWGDHRELGLPDTFLGGCLTMPGGTMNPGLFTAGLRRVLLASGVRVFEQTPVLGVRDEGAGAAVATAGGGVRAGSVVIANNAFAGGLPIVPENLATPVWVSMIETAPIDPGRVAATGWTSGAGLATAHNIMESYHHTARGTIAVGVRRLSLGGRHLDARTPDRATVADLTDAFRTRFPSLRDVPVSRTWGGWIALTPTHQSLAGHAGGHVFFAIGCNGHGLGQAPYLGSLLADRLAGDAVPEDLATVWSERSHFARPMQYRSAVLRAGWVHDRVSDLLAGRGRRRAHAG